MQYYKPMSNALNPHRDTLLYKFHKSIFSIFILVFLPKISPNFVFITNIRRYSANHQRSHCLKQSIQSQNQTSEFNLLVLLSRNIALHWCTNMQRWYRRLKTESMRMRESKVMENFEGKNIDSKWKSNGFYFGERLAMVVWANFCWLLPWFPWKLTGKMIAQENIVTKSR